MIGLGNIAIETREPLWRCLFALGVEEIEPIGLVYGTAVWPDDAAARVRHALNAVDARGQTSLEMQLAMATLHIQYLWRWALLVELMEA